MAKKQKDNYVSNRELTEELTKYVQKCHEMKSIGKDKPVVPDVIAIAIYKMSHRLATKPCFKGYSWKDEMIFDGIETCLRYIDRFNPEKSSNAFAYVTQILWNAFRRRINIEKEQAAIRDKMIGKHGLDHKIYDVQPQDIENYGDLIFQNSLTLGLQNGIDFNEQS